ncbi:NUDIX domain-containing protein [Kitasatospora sp. NPDC088783]|uniref:NUDIX domain-containing protein n=1 Tax=Kitasatospora sp. NPDC088783 TaxID=3364077 RepID=UPI0037FFDC17
MTAGPGTFITIDGPGGTGKSTAIPHLATALQAAGHTIHTATQPSKTPYGAAVRQVAAEMTGTALALAVAADRHHALATEIRPRLNAGHTVLLDRYLPSTLVLQRIDGVPLELLLAINAGIDVPDLAVILTADEDTILRRLAHRGTRHRFELDAAATRRELDLYTEATSVLTGLDFPVLTIDTTRLTPEGVAARIAHALPAPTDTNTPITVREFMSTTSPAQVRRPIVDVHVHVRDGDKILLSQRGGPYGHGQWHAPSGKLDAGETPAAAAARELEEETGLTTDPAALRLMHTVIHHQGDGTPDRIGFFFEATTWSGEPQNREPAKCLDLRWFAIHDLPEDLIPYPAAGLYGSLTDPGGLTYHNWP